MKEKCVSHSNYIIAFFLPLFVCLFLNDSMFVTNVIFGDTYVTMMWEVSYMLYFKHLNNFVYDIALFFFTSQWPIGKSAFTYLLIKIPPHAFPDPLLKFTEVFLARCKCLYSRSSKAGKTSCSRVNEMGEKFLSPFWAILAYSIANCCAVAKYSVAGQKLLGCC